jgi:NCS2 family nucleobase:cation symporter-2
MALPWKLHGDGKHVSSEAIVLPEERMTWPRTIGFGAQHVVAMFGATFLVPLLTGFPPTATLFFSGLGTLLFLLLTGNRLPSYLGSSFAFLAPIWVATGVGPGEVATPEGLARASFGILAMGVLMAIVGIIVAKWGTGWINALMPPVVMGGVVALIGFNLAPAVKNNWLGNPAANPEVNQGLHSTAAFITIVSILLITVLFRGIIGRLSIVLGMVVGYIAAALMGIVDFSGVESAAWIGLPDFHLAAVTDPAAWLYVPMFLPVVLVLIAENVGHVRGVATMTNDPSINKHTGRALVADGLATTLAGGFGGSATTTYGENIGVMAATRVYSTAAYWVAGGAAILLAFSPKIGVIFNSIPAGVLGGVTTALYGLIGVIGIKIWVDNRVDFSRPVNQYTVAVSFVIAVGGFAMNWGSFQLGAIVLGTVAALLIYHLGNAIARWRKTGADDGGPIPAVGQLGGDPE